MELILIENFQWHQCNLGEDNHLKLAALKIDFRACPYVIFTEVVEVAFMVKTVEMSIREFVSFTSPIPVASTGICVCSSMKSDGKQT